MRWLPGQQPNQVQRDTNRDLQRQARPSTTVIQAQSLTPTEALALMPGYRQQLIQGANYSTLATFLANSPKEMGRTYSPRGHIELFHWGGTSAQEAQSWLWSMMVQAATGETVTLTLPLVDDQVYVYLDGALVASRTSAAVNLTLTFAITPGAHCVQFLLNNSVGGRIMLRLTDWFTDHISWLRAGSV